MRDVNQMERCCIVFSRINKWRVTHDVVADVHELIALNNASYECCRFIFLSRVGCCLLCNNNIAYLNDALLLVLRLHTEANHPLLDISLDFSSLLDETKGTQVCFVSWEQEETFKSPLRIL